MRKILSKICAIIAIGTTVISMLPFHMNAESKVDSGLNEIQDIDKTDTVTLIVELEDKSSAVLYSEGEKKSFQDFIHSDTVKEQTNELLEQQELIAEKIMQTVPTTTNACKYQYTTIMNAFSIDVAYGDVKEIEKIKGVKNTYISKVYKPLTYQEDKSIQKEQKAEVATSKKQNQGKGMIISVIDTGFDMKLSDFEGKITNPSMTKGLLKKLKEKSYLNASDLSYYNSRFPVVYDYGDDDVDVLPTGTLAQNAGFHGTAVSSVVVNNVPQIQIFAMKVYDDCYGDCKQTAVLAALEDSAVLGADVINLSLGSVAGFSDFSNELEMNVYKNLKRLGIEISAAAGNYESSYSANSFGGLGLSSNPDNATIGEPATFEECTAVACSSDNGMEPASSWGANPNLSLKPEISAPGSNLYVPISDSQYTYLSGTSLAAPIISAYYAEIKSYINNEKCFQGMSEYNKGLLATQILMSTSQCVYNANGVPCSPRRQGSGVADIQKALQAKVYLYNTNVPYAKPKLNMYDDYKKTGKFEQEFHIKNVSNHAMTYELKNISLAPDVEERYNVKKFVGEEKDVSKQVKYTITVNGNKQNGYKIKVPAKSDVKVGVTFLLSNQLKKYYDKNMDNGGFFEGYLLLNAEEEKDNLSIPYLGFYGDWTKAPLFDTGWSHDGNIFSLCSNQLRTEYEGEESILGVNPYDTTRQAYILSNVNPFYYNDVLDYKTITPDPDKIAVSPDGDGNYDSVQTIKLCLLRNAVDMTVTVTDPIEKMEQDCLIGNINKTISFDGSRNNMGTFDIEQYLLEDLITNGENNSVIYVTFKGNLDYSRHESNNQNDSITFPFTIDKETPIILDAKEKTENGKTFLTVRVRDNQYVAKIDLKVKNVETEEYTLFAQELLDEEEKNVVSEVKFDITELVKSGTSFSDVTIGGYDYACNGKEYPLNQFLNN